MKGKYVTTDWTIPGSEGLELIGSTDAPRDTRGGAARACAVIVHGYKGYKDYGMFPQLGASLARAGIVAHRFNLAHSGMTRDVRTFERPDLFERDTWRFQVEDVAAVVDAVRAGTLMGAGVPVFLVGHSRGGASSILTAAWRGEALGLAGIVTINAPAACCSLPEADRESLVRDRYLETASARTGQVLRVGAAWLQEQLDAPELHDVVAQAARVACPALIVHGTGDQTVDPSNADRIAGAMGGRARVALIPGANHVMDTKNPTPADAPPSASLSEAIGALVEFVDANI